MSEYYCEERVADRSSSKGPETALTSMQKEAIPNSETNYAESGFSTNGLDVPHLKPGQDWKARFVRLGPLSGMSAMCLSIASIFAALGVLVGSDGSPVTDWSAPPSTFLAILTAVANLSVRIAAVQGAVIAWWYRASHRDWITIENLHYNWRSGSSLHGALMAGRRMGIIGFACVLSFVVPFIGQ